MCLNLQVYPSRTLSMGYCLKKGKKTCCSLKFGFVVKEKKEKVNRRKKTKQKMLKNIIVEGVKRKRKKGDGKKKEKKADHRC